ncbi:unnamed protein product, partial [Didymodactylos carnosus]
MSHADGMSIVTTKPKKFYVITGTIIEIPPPYREYAKNKLLLGLYLSENEPTASMLFEHLVYELKLLIASDYIFVINNINIQLRFQLFKADLPCRSLCTCIKQHNGYYACSHCLQRGNTLANGSNNVYYPYVTTSPSSPRTHQQYVIASNQAELNNGQLSVEGIFGASPLLSLFSNVQSNVPFDYMHLCC